MHPLDFSDYGGERKESLHYEKEKEGVIIHHSHVLNLVLLDFSPMFSQVLKPID